MTNYRIDARELRLEKTISFWTGAAFGAVTVGFAGLSCILLVIHDRPTGRSVAFIMFLLVTTWTLYLVNITKPNRVTRAAERILRGSSSL